MKRIYGIIALITIGVTGCLLTAASNNTNEQELSSPTKQNLDQNPYEGLRTRAFETSKEQLELTTVWNGNGLESWRGKQVTGFYFGEMM